MLRRTLREFMQREYPLTAVRAAETTERGYDLALYHRLNDLGVVGLGLSEAVGGAGGTWVDLAVFYEEAGRALLASPHLSSVVLGGGLLARHGSAAQQQAWLSQLAQGARVLAVGWPFDAGEAGPSSLRARRADGGYTLSGEVPRIAHYVGADGVLLVAEVEGSGGQQALFLADARTPGLTATPLPTMTGAPLVRLGLEDAR